VASNDLTFKPSKSISQLAREHGVARSTIRRRLAKGWEPPGASLAPSAEILPPLDTSRLGLESATRAQMFATHLDLDSNLPKKAKMAAPCCGSRLAGRTG
jgi:hypothetical protein